MVKSVSVYWVNWLALWLLFEYSRTCFHSQVSGLQSTGLSIMKWKVRVDRIAVFHCKTRFVSLHCSLKADERSCIFMSPWCNRCMCVCVRLRLRVSHECAWRWVRQWLGFAAAWGAQRGAEMGSDSRYHRLQTSPVIPQQHDGPVLYQDPETLLRINFSFNC